MSRKPALLCPGQGAQAVGMGKDFAAASPACRDLFERANALMGLDLDRICFEGPEEELTRSSHAQPGIFLASMAAVTVLRERIPGWSVAAAAGLSSGEWTALHLAGVLSFEDTVRVLEARGRFMQAACEGQDGGMMSIIGLDVEVIRGVCEAGGVWVANLNSARQTVISGEREQLEVVGPQLKEAGAKLVVPLKVAGAFHSPLMQAAADQLGEFLNEIAFSDPAYPVISNLTGTWHGGAEAIRAAMVEQVVSPVRWWEGIETLAADGVNQYWEAGPGKVLSGLLKRIDKKAAVHTIHDLTSAEAVSAAE